MYANVYFHWYRFGIGILSLGGLAYVAASRLDDTVNLTVTRHDDRSAGAVTLEVNPTQKGYYRIETSADLKSWRSLVSYAETSAKQVYESNGDSEQYFRVVQLEESPILTGDHHPTASGDLVVHPVEHASLVMAWDGKIIFVDPTGGAARYREFPAPDVIVITDIHGDHQDVSTLNGLDTAKAQLVVPSAVNANLPLRLKGQATVLANEESGSVAGIDIEAIPMYNITSGRTQYHSKGRGNGYVLTFAGLRVYVSGDTEDIPEMRSLDAIDVAFLCMNLPFTMDVNQAAAAVREFQPKVVYPYHHRGSNMANFTSQVGSDLPVEVRLRNWYP